MSENHHCHDPDCESCRAVGQQAEKEGYFAGVEKMVRKYEKLPWVQQARRDGRLAQHHFDALKQDLGEEDKCSLKRWPRLCKKSRERIHLRAGNR